jgi:hypothetical protein
LASEITKIHASLIFLVELNQMCHVWLYWAGGKLKQRMTAAVGMSNTKNGLKAVIDSISVEL